MISEFIVWDEKKKRFIDGDEFAIDDNGKVYSWLGDSRLVEYKGKPKLFPYIGKTDEERNGGFGSTGER